MSAPKILIVEDDAIEALDIKHTLESFGYSVLFVASKGEEAIKKASSLKPDLILMDIILKDELDGIKVSECIKDLNIPVIYLTAHSEDSIVQRAKLTQPYAYILKPYDSFELKYAIEMALYKHEMDLKLKESESRYKNIVETSMEGIWVMDSNFKTVFVNDRIGKILGYKIEEMIGKPVTFFMFEEDLGDHQSHMKSRMDGISESYERRFRSKDGKEVWTIVSATALQDNKGNFTGSFGMFTDITERKRIEEELEEERYKLREYFENLPLLAYNIDLDGKILDCNKMVLKTLGYENKHELIGKPLLKSIYFPSSLKKAKKLLMNLKETGKLHDEELQIISKDGDIIDVQLNVDTIYDTEGTPLYNIYLQQDISDRKKTEKALKESENYYRTIFENTGTATVIIEDDTTISMVNSEFEKLSGYSREEIENKKSWTEFVYEEDLKQMLEYHSLRRTGGKKAPRTYEFRFINKNKVLKYIFLNVAVIPGTKKSVASLLDVTQRKYAEEDLKKSEEKYRLVVETASEGIVVLDWKGKIVDINNRALEMAGLVKKDMINKNFIEILPKIKIDKKRVLHNFKNIILGKPGDEKYWIMNNAKGEKIKFMVHYSTIKLDKKNLGISAILEDITNQVKAENKLKESLKEKEILLKEIHHRVKNNLQIISSLLNLQSSYVKNKYDLEIFEESRNRVKSMAMVHEKLYQSEDMARINFKDYIISLGSELFASYKVEPIIKLNIQVQEVMLDINTAIPCGLILNELMSNSIKHAFPNSMEGTISIKMITLDNIIEIMVSDDGVGIPENIDFSKTKTLGLQIVNNLVRQLDGSIELDRSDGTAFKITFKKLNY
ncbi:MAG: hypothetical protein Kow0019_01670 [Methanobacteriaceae archaeon]